MLPNWDAMTARLHEETCRAIARFVAGHPTAICSFVALAAEPAYGHFQACFDTADNALRQAREAQREAIARRARMLTHPWSWYDADYFLGETRLVDHSASAGLFAHCDSESIVFPELADWDAISAALIATPPPTGCPPGTTPEEAQGEDAKSARLTRYLAGQTRLMLWRVLERLSNEDAFAPLPRSSPFRVGFELHDEPLLVLRILNWPQP